MTVVKNGHDKAGETKYPNIEVKLTGVTDAISVIHRVQKSLKDAGLNEEAVEYARDAWTCSSYDELLRVTLETVTVS